MPGYWFAEWWWGYLQGTFQKCGKTIIAASETFPEIWGMSEFGRTRKYDASA
jgi:hypothetical protein